MAKPVCSVSQAGSLVSTLSGNSDCFRTVLVQGNSDVFPHVGSLPVKNERVVHLKLAKTDMFVRRAAAFCTFVNKKKVQAHHGSTSAECPNFRDIQEVRCLTNQVGDSAPQAGVEGPCGTRRMNVDVQHASHHAYGSFPIRTHYKPQLSTVLIMGTPKKIPWFWQTPYGDGRFRPGTGPWRATHLRAVDISRWDCRVLRYRE